MPSSICEIIDRTVKWKRSEKFQQGKKVSRADSQTMSPKKIPYSKKVK